MRSVLVVIRIELVEEVTWQNPFAERVIGSIRCELLDHVIVLHERHLRRRLRSYLRYYHGSRTHLALEKDAPEPRAIERPEQGRARCPVPGRRTPSSVRPPRGVAAGRQDLNRHILRRSEARSALARWISALDTLITVILCTAAVAAPGHVQEGPSSAAPMGQPVW